MNPAIFSLLAPSAPSKTDGADSKASKNSVAVSAMFGNLLNSTLGAVRLAPNILAAANSADAASQALAAKIARMRNAGASEADIASTLAAQLAAAVAKALNSPSADARAQLQAVFAGALAPPGDAGGAAGSLADRLRNLAQRFLKVQTIATSAAGGRQLGQQNYLAGTFLDATTARETPAPVEAKQTAKSAAVERAASPIGAPGRGATFGARLEATTAGQTLALVAKQTTASAAAQDAADSATLKVAPSTEALAQAAMLAGSRETVSAANEELAALKHTSTVAGTSDSSMAALKEASATAGASETLAALEEASRFAGTSETATALKDASMSAVISELSKSADVKEAPTSAAVKETLTSAAVKETLTSAAVKETLTSAAVKEPLTSTAIKETLTSAAVKETQTSAAVEETLTSAAVKETPSSAVDKAMAASAAVKETAAAAAGAVQAAGGTETTPQSSSAERAVVASAPTDAAYGSATAAAALDAVAAVAGEGTQISGLAADAQPAADQRDGRTVKRGDLVGVSMGGDTPLGRALARAAATAVPPQTLAAPSAAGSGSAIPETAAANQQAVTNQLTTKDVAHETARAASPLAAARAGSQPGVSALLAAASPETAVASAAFLPVVVPLGIEHKASRPPGRVSTGAASSVASPATESAGQPEASAAASSTASASSAAGLAAEIPVIADADQPVDTDQPAADADQPADAVRPAAADESARKAAAPDTVLAAFVKSFESALGTIGDAARTPQRDDVPAALSPASASAVPGPAGAPAGFVAALAPLRIEQSTAPAAPAPLTYATPVDQAAIVDQVLRGVSLRNTGASSEIRLSLVPQALGDVNIQLVVSAGNVTAHVVAQTPEVRDALVAAQPELAKSLADAGLKLQGLTVDLSGSGFAGFSQHHAHQSPSGNGGGRAAGMSDNEMGADDAANAALEAVPSFGPSTLATARVGAYNYLV
jgi:hypothetical protein